MIIIPVIFLLLIVAFQIYIIIWNNDTIDSQERTIWRMQVSWHNQNDREKNLLERIKYLEHHEAITI